jgi:hypothetical protein
VATAAARARAVDWQAVYAPTPARRRLATAAMIVAVSLVVLLLPSGRVRLAARGDAPATPTAASEAAAKLAEVLEALAAAEISAEDARELLRDMLRNPSLDPNLRKQIQSMTGNQQDKTSDAPNQMGEAGDKDQQASGEGQPQGAPEDSDDLEWALSETASKMANEDAHKGGVPQSDEGESKTPSESSDSDKVKQPTPATAKQSAEDRERKTSGGAGLSLETESAERNAGGQRGEGLSSSGAGDTDSARALADARETSEALAREIVRAIDSPEGKNVQVEEARRTEAKRSSIGFSGIEGLSAYDRSKADTSAIVPEARRPLLERYFVREAK